MQHEILISYSNTQKSIADGVCHFLEENGYRCYGLPCRSEKEVLS